MVAPAVAICEKALLSVERSILKPLSFVELSFQVRSTSVVDVALAARFVGATGSGMGVGEGGEVGSPGVTQIILATDGTLFPFRIKSM
jgi:hypothetical protein